MAMLVHIARTVRGLWPKNRTVIALTGSVGKTTTKDLCASIFSQVGHTYQTQGNQNNLLGVSLTIMNVPKTCQYAIIELGINARFEMITLAELVRPDITQAAGKARRVYYGQDGEHAPIKMYDLKLDGQSFAQFTLAADGNAQSCSLQIIGGHQVNNALAAATCALELGVDLPHIVRGLEEYKGAKNRLQLIESGYAGATVLMDAYNANPLSLEKALETIGYFGKREKCLVLGDMGELGEESVKWHEQAAGLAMQYGVNRLLTVGKLSQHAQKQFQGYGQHYETVESLQEALRDHLHNDMVVLIKGSRSMQLEKLTEVVLDKKGA
jgi:UDP-N-acetylmuramoyl-tripeptide--D-alanyl-D-alanine ligase